MLCPNCRKQIDENSNFCQHCGSKVVVENKCPHCGAMPLPLDAKFCPDCGKAIEEDCDEAKEVLSSSQQETVELLSRVLYTNLENNIKMLYTIVNPDEADLRRGLISSEAPIAKALLGKRVGEVVDAHTPGGIIRLRIESVSSLNTGKEK